jgi:carbamoyltransferase
MGVILTGPAPTLTYVGRRVIVLGISGGHDANWCVVRDGVLLGAFEKERFTRTRHDGGEVVGLVEPSLRQLGLAMTDVDCLATSEPVWQGQDPGHVVLGGRRYERLGDWQWQVARCLGRVLPCLSVPHHVAHAAYAHYTGAAPVDAVLTVDGGGDAYTVDAGAATTVSSWRGARLEWIERIDNSDIGSLWWAYAHAIFGDRQAAGKLMGLAALGSDRLVEAMRDRVVRPVTSVLDGAVTVKDFWSDFASPPFVRPGRGWQDPEAADVAFAVQAVTTEAGVSLARAARAVTGHPALALSGGVALNGYLTSAVARDAGFDTVHIPPAVHDGGIAAGAALFASHHELGVPWDPGAPRELAFLGPAHPAERVDRALRDAGLPHRRAERDEAVEAAADVLAAGGFVAWFEGRSEHGPRALGHRSLLSSPLTDAHRERLNREVKFREPFRPVAPVVLESDAARYFELDGPSLYMMRIVGARAAARREAPAAVHVDGTSRVQTVDGDCSLGRVIAAFGARTGTPIVINTSFNVREPIIETPEEALATFARAPIELLYLDGNLVSRSD